MDAPDVPPRELRRAFVDIARSNRWLGGHAASLSAVADLIVRAARDGASPVRVLDVGCGGGDFAVALLAWAAREGLEVEVVAVDPCPVAADWTRRQAAGRPGLHVLRADGLRPPFAAGRVHVVHAAMVLHHVPRAEQAAFVASLAEVATVGGGIADLRRACFPYFGVALWGRLAGAGRLFRHDGPLSVARGFTPEEAEDIAREAGLTDCRVETRFPSRLTWSWGPRPLAKA
ncbi:MAG: methyltransferase domain-containing protein [Acidobacteriota bacterium]